MNISSSLRPKQVIAAQSSAPQGPPSHEEPQDTGISAQDIVTKGAYATGGALGGVGLGVVTGNLMTSLTGVPLFSSVGGIAGGLGGAATGLAVSDSQNRGRTMYRVFAGWAGSSVGSLAGQSVATAAGQALSASGAAPWIGAVAPVVGTAVGALAGATLPLVGADGKIPTLVKNGAKTGLGVAAGLGIGAGIQAIVANGAPVLAPAATVAPILGAVALGSMVLNGTSKDERFGETFASTSAVSAFGYALGMVGGGFAQLAGASQAASLATPIAGAIGGALYGYSGSSRELPGQKTADKAAGVVTGAGVGTTLGDLGGMALTAVTGNDIYRNAGSVVGGLNGALIGLSASGVDSHKATPAVVGATAGTATGALIGAALENLTGQTVWGVVMPVLGAAAGGLSSVAATFGSAKAQSSKDGAAD